MSPEANPFAVLSLVVAPAIMTNACLLLLRDLRSLYIALSGKRMNRGRRSPGE